ncbi:hypothetical protein [Nostoc flagelliforme]|nr:hypothetical protein [Nostoc flagelliforme]
MTRRFARSPQGTRAYGDRRARKKCNDDWGYVNRRNHCRDDFYWWY